MKKKMLQNVKSLMERYSVNIHFPRNDTESDIVVINGMKRGVDKAKAEMLELFEYEVFFSQSFSMNKQII